MSAGESRTATRRHPPLNAVLLLAILPFMRRLALDPAVMGEQTLSARGRWVTAGALAMIAASVGALFVLTAF